MRKKRTTLRDVAERANVSTAVVSYVINNGPRPTSPEIRARVLQAITELDYHPNSIARGLRARRSQMIGFIANDFNALDSFSSHYLASILTSFTAELKQHAHYMVLYPLTVGEDLAPLEALLRSGRLDGVALRRVADQPPPGDPLLTMITRAEMPCVCIERPAREGFGIPSILYDDLGGGVLATTHLLKKGHRRIAHLQGDPRYASAQARLAGYQQALTDAGIAIDPDLIRVANWNQPDAARLTRELMELPEPPTAIFAASDDMALGVLETLRAMELRTPDDVAVVGFDGIALGQQAVLPLTSIRIPLAEIGRRAADALITDADLDAGPRDPITETLPVELIVGQTT